MSADIGRRHINPFGDIAVAILCSVPVLKMDPL